MRAINSTAACVLGMLDLGPPPPARREWSARRGMTGSELWNALDASVAGFWSMTRSQVYQEVRKLADDGLVTETNGRYRINGSGRVAAKEWFDAFARAEPKDEQIRSPIGLTVFFGHYLPDDVLMRVVGEHELRFRRRLDGMRVIEAAVGDDASLPATLLRRAILMLEGAIRWTEELRVRGSTSRRAPRARRERATRPR